MKMAPSGIVMLSLHNYRYRVEPDATLSEDMHTTHVFGPDDSSQHFDTQVLTNLG